MADVHLDLDAVKLLPPTDPGKVIAVGLNYLSHLGGREPAAEPGLFAKYPSSLVGDGDDIVVPPGSTDLHFEGEMVLVIGATCKDATPEHALFCVFGVTAGNDVSERGWQASDLQWLRAKGADTFGPVGPAMVVGLDPDDLLLQTRVNGETVQSERTSDLIFDVATMVSYISRYFTLEPGDLIFTGTPGTTSALSSRRRGGGRAGGRGRAHQHRGRLRRNRGRRWLIRPRSQPRRRRGAEPALSCASSSTAGARSGASPSVSPRRPRSPSSWMPSARRPTTA